VLKDFFFSRIKQAWPKNSGKFSPTRYYNHDCNNLRLTPSTKNSKRKNYFVGAAQFFEPRFLRFKYLINSGHTL